MNLSVLLLTFGTFGYASADCYPGDVAYNMIIQEIYRGVISDNIVFTYLGNSSMNRYDLCTILVNNHNYRKNPGQHQTNGNYLGVFITQSACVNSLTYTTGYNSLADWEKWDGYQEGKWYSKAASFDDDAQWESYYTESIYAVQSVRFNSQWHQNNCRHVDMNGRTCLFGWRQSGQGVIQ